MLELVNRKQRQILVHSYIYYQLNESIIDDFTYDMWSIELAELMSQNEEIARKSVYYEDFKDFDGSSGFNLPFSNPEIQDVGNRLLKIHRYIVK